MMRYSRITSVEDIGEAGIRKLQEARVLVIGCGALGSLCSMYLAASGVGNLTIADFDTVDLSNLQRQLFFTEEETGRKKSELLGQRIRLLNSTVNLDIVSHLIDRRYAETHFPEFDFIVDGSDNPSTKLMTDRYCFEADVRNCIGGVREFSGQVMSWRPGSPRFSSVFGQEDCGAGFTPCSIGGVVGPAAGVVASVQASECIKAITGAGECLYGKVLFFDMRSNSFNVIPVS